MKPAPIKDEISFKDFEKLDIRVGTILSVSEIEKSNKLVKLMVDFGDHTRSILAGIKQERENPKEIENKQALFVLNLPERKMAGEYLKECSLILAMLMVLSHVLQCRKIQFLMVREQDKKHITSRCTTLCSAQQRKQPCADSV